MAALLSRPPCTRKAGRATVLAAVLPSTVLDTVCRGSPGQGFAWALLWLVRGEAIKVWAPPCKPHSESVGLLGFSRPERFCANLFDLGRVG